MSFQEHLMRRVNLGDVLRRTASRVPDATALIEGPRRIAYRRLHQDANRFGSALLGRGLRPGDRVVVMATNSIEFLVACFGCARAGLVFTPINVLLRGPEALYIVNNAEAAALLIDDVLLAQVQGAFGEMRTVKHFVVNRVSGDSAVPSAFTDFAALLAEGGPQDVEVEAGDRDTALLMYTSGTTSNPKGATLSHLSMVMNAFSAITEFDIRPGDVHVGIMPFFHIAQLNLSINLVHVGGIQVIFKKFEPEPFLAAVQRERANSIFLLPMMYRALLDLPALATYDLSTLRLAIYAMAPIANATLAELIAKVCPNFALAFGQTEMAPVTTIFRPGDQLRKAGSVGSAHLNVDLAIMDDEGRFLASNEVGEVVYRSPQVMNGYFRDPQATAEAFRFGWFHSGDLGYLDEDGFLWFVDRKKDMVKSGGENVASIEVEKVLLSHPAVADAACLGLPHRHWIEAVTGMVTLRSDARATEAEIVAFCKERLAGYKVPKAVIILGEDFPRTATGKIRKNVLRERYATLYDGVAAERSG